MIRLVELDLPEATARQLAVWQAVIDGLPDFATKVAQADLQFKARNTGVNPVFREVRRHLDAMCCGERRCMYCEDSCADEVEHVRPKALFPELVFAWRNYIYACGPCNGIKRSNFPRLARDKVRNVARRRGDPIEPPPAGIDLLIDPRVDDPAEFFMLDLYTGVLLPRPSLFGLSRQRAEQTIEVLKLNRDVLLRARMQHCRNYLARLREYIHIRDEDPCGDADDYARSVCAMGHPMVWNEIRRQHAKHPALHGLFTRAPEALAWEPCPQGLAD